MKNVEDLYPLTPTQSGMLFQILRDEDPELYFEQVRADLVGVVDPEVVRSAFNDATDRHPALRSAIAWEGLEQPLQAVRTTFTVPFEVLDRPGITDSELYQLSADRRQTPFDLTGAPLQRVAVVDCGEGRLHLIWEFHHIICDGWSAAIVLNEIVESCNGKTQSDPAAPFRNYLAWHQAQDGEATAAYWKQLLDGFFAATPIALPVVSTATSFLAGQHTESIGGDSLAALEGFARRKRVTLNTLVQAAWSLMQSVYSGADDVVFGVTTSGRPAELDGVQGTAGMFLNTLPMRVNVDRDQSIDSWLHGVQNQQLASAENASASLAQLHRQVGISVGEDLFDSVLIFENFPRPERDPIAPVSLENKTVFEQTNYPLTLMVGIEGDLKLVANYDRHRFTDASIVTLMQQFAQILNDLPSAQTVSELNVLTEQDLADISEWQGRSISLAPDTTVIGELIAQATRTPDAVALIDGGHQISFCELVDRARGVAARLERLGVGPEVPVGIAIPRSVNMVAAIVGVMLAGGAYVPLDPRFPQARLRLMMEVSGAPVVLTDTESVAAVPELDDVQVIDASAIPQLRGGPAPTSPSTPDSTMLVTFTSGSTGVPKGVRVHHAGVINRCVWQWDQFPLQDGEVFPAKTTLGFVDHLWEIWGGLLKGSPVLLIDDDTVTNAEALITRLGELPIRRISLVPSLLDLLLDHEPKLAERLPDLSMWSVSGEALSVVTADRFHAALPQASLINLYGMSEASQDATFIEVGPGQEGAPIGRPIANMAVHLLDGHDRLVPVGVPGELHVSGIGVSPGYWKRPDLTSERFVSNPLAADASDPHHRMYRTGDIARRRPDGVLEYLGRTDHQVKIRGVRIELGEVETALASHPQVERSVVLGRPGPAGTELVAYVIAADGLGSDSLNEALRTHAHEQLPEVMVPSHFVELEDFLLLPNGKVDRASLPDPVRSTPAPVEDGVLTGAQSGMLTLWRQVMEQPGLGVDADFFDAGGHSMLAMRLVSRIKTDLGLNVGLSQLLKTGTARSLADVLAASVSVASPGTTDLTHVVPIREYNPRLRNLFVVHGAGGDVLNFRPLGNHLKDVVNVIGIQAGGVDGISAVHTDRVTQIADYLAEIRVIQPEGPYLVAGFSIGGLIAVELVKHLNGQGSSVDALILFDSFHPSLEPREISKSEHLSKLLRTPRYGLEKLQQKVDARRDEKQRSEALRQGSSDLVPFEVRKWEITNNSIRLWHDYHPAPIEAPLIMISARENSDIWDGIADDRGWSAVATDLRVIRVDGDHMTLVEEVNVSELAKRLVSVLTTMDVLDA